MSIESEFDKLKKQTLFLVQIAEELSSAEYGEGVSFNLPQIIDKIKKQTEWNMLELKILGFGYSAEETNPTTILTHNNKTR